MTMPLDFSGVIPIEFSAQIIEEAVQQSAVLRLANTVPMGTTISEMPVPKTLPSAAWVSVAGRKPYTDLALEMQTLHAEEVAAVTAIPDVYLEDSTINLWGWVRPRLAEAIAVAVDSAMLFGTNAPATFPAGGINAVATSIAAGATDVVDALNDAMALVEGQGLPVTGTAADLTVRSKLRNARATTGELLLDESGVSGVTTGSVGSIYGAPIAYVPFVQQPPDLFTGDWNAAIVGVRQDIRYNMDPSAVIADSTGKVIISGWQDNVTPLKVWARFAFTIVKPVTVRVPAGAIPFAKADVSAFTRSAQAAPASHGGRK